MGDGYDLENGRCKGIGKPHTALELGTCLATTLLLLPLTPLQVQIGPIFRRCSPTRYADRIGSYSLNTPTAH